MAFINRLKDERNHKFFILRINYVYDGGISGPLVGAKYFSNYPVWIVNHELTTEPFLQNAPRFVRGFDFFENNVINKGSYKFDILNNNQDYTQFFEENGFTNQIATLYVCCDAVVDLSMDENENWQKLGQFLIKDVTVGDTVSVNLDELSLYERMPLVGYNKITGPFISPDTAKENYPYLVGKVDEPKNYNVNEFSDERYRTLSVTGTITYSLSGSGSDDKYYHISINTLAEAQELLQWCHEDTIFWDGSQELKFRAVQLFNATSWIFQFTPGIGDTGALSIPVTLSAKGEFSQNANNSFIVSAGKTAVKKSANPTGFNGLGTYERIYMPDSSWLFLQYGDLVHVEFRPSVGGSVLPGYISRVKYALRVQDVGEDGTGYYIDIQPDSRFPTISGSGSSAVPYVQMSYYYVSAIGFKNTNNFMLNYTKLEMDQSSFELKVGTWTDLSTSTYFYFNTITNRSVYTTRSGYACSDLTDISEKNYGVSVCVFLRKNISDPAPTGFDHVITVNLDNINAATAFGMMTEIQLALRTYTEWGTATHPPMFFSCFQKRGSADTLVIKNYVTSNIPMEPVIVGGGANFTIDGTKIKTFFNYIEDQYITSGVHYIDVDYIACSLGSGEQNGVITIGSETITSTFSFYTSIATIGSWRISATHNQPTGYSDYAGLAVYQFINKVNNTKFNKVIAKVVEANTFGVIGSGASNTLFQFAEKNIYSSSGYSRSVVATNYDTVATVFKPVLATDSNIQIYYKDESASIGRLIKTVLTDVYGLTAGTHFVDQDLTDLNNISGFSANIISGFQSGTRSALYEFINNMLQIGSLYSYIDNLSVMRFKILKYHYTGVDEVNRLDATRFFNQVKKITMPTFSKIETSYYPINGEDSETHTYTFTPLTLAPYFMDVTEEVKSPISSINPFDEVIVEGKTLKEMLYDKLFNKRVTLEVQVPMEYLIYQPGDLFRVVNGYVDPNEVWMFYEYETDLNVIKMKLVKLYNDVDYLVDENGDIIVDETGDGITF